MICLIAGVNAAFQATRIQFFQPSTHENALEWQSNPWLPTRELVLDRCTPSSALWRHITHEKTMAAPTDAVFMQVVHGEK